LISKHPGKLVRQLKIFFVTKRLAFGSAITTWADVEQLQRLGVTHVINLKRNKNSKKVRQFTWLWLPFKHDNKPRPRWFYRKVLRFYERATRKSNRKVLVMCHYGISRSASLAYILLRASNHPPSRAEYRVRKARPNAKIVRAYRESGEEYLRRKHSEWSGKNR
jgi:protein-tyrosine phosphatase